jgi:hypothetical protein
MIRREISKSAVSVGLLICSALWLAGARVYYATSGFNSDWSATPLLWMLVVTVTPAICFSALLILVEQEKREGLSRLDCCALAVGSLPIVLGTVLAVSAVKGLLSMAQ